MDSAAIVSPVPFLFPVILLHDLLQQAHEALQARHGLYAPEKLGDDGGAVQGIFNNWGDGRFDSRFHQFLERAPFDFKNDVEIHTLLSR